MDMNKVDEGMYWVSQSLLLADWGQTREIVSNETYYETNPIMQLAFNGQPTLNQVNLWFGGALLGNHLIEEIEINKPEYRQLKLAFRTGAIIMQAANVINNKQIGIGFKF